MGNEAQIRVKIVNGREEWWYDKHIGEEYAVYPDRDNYNYYCLYRPILGKFQMMMHHIHKEDCEIIADNQEK